MGIRELDVPSQCCQLVLSRYRMVVKKKRQTDQEGDHSFKVHGTYDPYSPSRSDTTVLSKHTVLDESYIIPLSLEELPRFSSQLFCFERIIL